MNKENDLIDSLLKEHAKMKNGGHRDELFLEELERRLDEEEGKDQIVADGGVVFMISKKGLSNKNRWGLGLGVAACAAIGFMGYQSYNAGRSESDLVLTTNKANEQIAESALMGDGAKRAPGQIAKKMPREQKEAPELTTDAIEEPIRAEINPKFFAGAIPKTSLAAEVPLPNMKIPEPSVDFGDANEFGEGFRANSDPGGGGVLEQKKNQMSRATSRKKSQPSVKPMPPNDRRLNGMDAQAFHQGHSKDMRPNHPHPSPNKAERYGDLIENKFISPTSKDTKLSTFAVDVDTASYANLRRMISSNTKVPANAVRIEEMMNYFDYNYAQPKGEHPFAVHVDAATCPWNDKNKLVRIAIQGKDLMRDKRPASNIVFLLDVSGSMKNANKLPLLKESLKYLLEELNEKDTVSIVVYAEASGLALPPTHVNDQGRRNIIASLGKLSAGGSTAGGKGIKLAYKIAKENFIKDGVNRVILATDGDFNVGVSRNKGLTDLVKKEAKGGVYLSVLGFGSGNINDDMLETITNNGNGNYSYIDSIKEGRKVLLEDMMGTLVTIAKDVKVRVEFNPEKVKEYRLVGYANRVLPNSAFLDKRADAGEIGAGHTVTAFYEVVPGKAADKAKLDNLRFEKKKEAPESEVPAEHSDKLLFVDLAYKQPDQKIDDESTYLSVPLIDVDKAWTDADGDFKFASSVALFGMVLSDSDFKANGGLDLVEKLAEEGKGNDGKGHRGEFLELVKKAKARK